MFTCNGDKAAVNRKLGSTWTRSVKTPYEVRSTFRRKSVEYYTPQNWPSYENREDINTIIQSYKNASPYDWFVKATGRWIIQVEMSTRKNDRCQQYA